MNSKGIAKFCTHFASLLLFSLYTHQIYVYIVHVSLWYKVINSERVLIVSKLNFPPPLRVSPSSSFFYRDVSFLFLSLLPASLPPLSLPSLSLSSKAETAASQRSEPEPIKPPLTCSAEIRIQTEQSEICRCSINNLDRIKH